MGRQSWRVDSALEDSTGICFDDVRGIYIDVETQDKGRVSGLEFSGDCATPGNEALGPRGAWGGDTTGEVALDGEVGDCGGSF